MTTREATQTVSLSEEMQGLLDQLKQAENDMQALEAFIDDGGSSRVFVTIEHRDPAIRARVERIASRLPVERFLVTLRNDLGRDIAKARSELLNAAMAHTVTDHIQAAAE
ncbi:hypothetical protein [Ciceribacter sp. L1K22]|uniref:hypothetical protein n=1 Tax=Ciceribacter sp. L1K22 TaxID=2820275 RepID=UPI001ABDD1DA|nr:hypothetical protein [Ciceribacter sp. L1K22]MBO3760385.1 hypothetical protein [Ciceribacter sp. L1K22]